MAMRVEARGYIRFSLWSLSSNGRCGAVATCSFLFPINVLAWSDLGDGVSAAVASPV